MQKKTLFLPYPCSPKVAAVPVLGSDGDDLCANPRSLRHDCSVGVLVKSWSVVVQVLNLDSDRGCRDMIKKFANQY